MILVSETQIQLLLFLKADKVLDLSETLNMNLNLTDVSVWMCVHVFSYCVARGLVVHQFPAQGVVLHV